MSASPWEIQCSVNIQAPAEFAWQFWTNVANWRELEPGVEFELDGPFAAGTTGRTRMLGQDAREWTVRDVDPGVGWTQEIALPGASFLVSMHFEKVAERQARITQRLWLEGDGAAAFVEAVKAFEASTPAGLKRIAAVIEKAAGG